MVSESSAVTNSLDKQYRKLLRVMGKTIHTYNLIEKNDRIMVCVSGGKDSLALLHLLIKIRKRSPVPFTCFAYTLDQNQPEFNTGVLEEHYRSLGVEYHIEKHNVYDIVQEKLDPNATQCSLCSRLRRGILYTEAERLGATKMAMGHHADDAAETLLLNLFYTGRMAAIPPKLISDDKKNTVIRPLIEVSESQIIEFASTMKLPVIPCSVCGSQENLQRQRIKRLLSDEEKNNPHLKSSIKSALRNVQPRHLWQVEPREPAD